MCIHIYVYIYMLIMIMIMIIIMIGGPWGWWCCGPWPRAPSPAARGAAASRADASQTTASPYWDDGSQRVWLTLDLNVKGWNSQAHREFPGKFESSNLSRDNLRREIGRMIREGPRFITLRKPGEPAWRPTYCLSLPDAALSQSWQETKVVLVKVFSWIIDYFHIRIYIRVMKFMVCVYS